eukprot:gnl/Hemi2/163_TR47_c0_g1_i1.p1 gnl/Hemi2/163_TR47_c0_g1~~gnl/Hemi2/163_TR47_c0_g1_i1.p1  ORF type:complete len:417 (+),score=48.66 gnl/Hemi2/163_TR47_c0_g1_i1:89-1339(+)
MNELSPEEILELAANPASRLDNVVVKGSQGHRPLLYFLYMGDEESAMVLLAHPHVTAGLSESGAGLSGMTPLHFAAEMGMVGVLRLLVQLGASVDARTTDSKLWSVYHSGGRTPLHSAAIKGQDQCVEALLTSGADLSAQDLDGNTAYILALWNNKTLTASKLHVAGTPIPAAQQLVEKRKQDQHSVAQRLLEVETAQKLSLQRSLAALIRTPPQPPLQRNVDNIIILPGKACVPTFSANWYSDVAVKLAKLMGCTVELPWDNMPEPFDAHESQWLPFIKSKWGHCLGSKTVLIGHSSGGDVLMRLMETTQVAGAVLVGVSHDDIPTEEERASPDWDEAYYQKWKRPPYLWEAIRRNAGWLVQLSSADDEVVSITQQRLVRDDLKPQFYTEYTDKGHFIEKSCDEVVDAVCRRCWS